MTNYEIEQSLHHHRRLMLVTAPRKLQLSIPGDRTLARLVLLQARTRCRRLGVRGYDRTLLVAAILAQEAGPAYGHGVKDHVSRTLALAALD